MTDYGMFSKKVKIENFAHQIKNIESLSRQEKIGYIVFILSVPTTLSLLIYNNIAGGVFWVFPLFVASGVSIGLLLFLLTSIFYKNIINYKTKEHFYTKVEKHIALNRFEYALVLNLLDKDDKNAINGLPDPNDLEKTTNKLIENYKENLLNKESLEMISSYLKKTGELYHDEKKSVVLNYLLQKYNEQVEQDEKTFEEVENNMAKAGIGGAPEKERRKLVIEELS